MYGVGRLPIQGVCAYKRNKPGERMSVVVVEMGSRGDHHHLVIVSFLLLVLHASSSSAVLAADNACYFPAIFNFGDSNSHTGGETADGKLVGRASDGRLIIDFMVENLGLPRLNAYTDSEGTYFRHGANFAAGGATIRPQSAELIAQGFSPLSLDVQVQQLTQLKNRAADLYNQGSRPNRENYPKPEDFYTALYTLDIGQNDLAAGFKTVSDEQLRGSIPDILNQFSQSVQSLYAAGARRFWIHNTGPIGCLPHSVTSYAPTPDNRDPSGCIRPQNEVAREFNRQLRERVSQLRQQLPDAALTCVDVYSAKYALIADAQNQGFYDAMKVCCGGGEGWAPARVGCGSSCADPSKYVSWDGVHYSEAANRWVANRIVGGGVADNQRPLSQACYKS